MEEDYVMIPGSGTKKIIRDVKKEIETAFLDYSMSVIVSRALPDVRDGLKPVHPNNYLLNSTSLMMQQLMHQLRDGNSHHLFLFEDVFSF